MQTLSKNQKKKWKRGYLVLRSSEDTSVFLKTEDLWYANVKGISKKNVLGLCSKIINRNSVNIYYIIETIQFRYLPIPYNIGTVLFKYPMFAGKQQRGQRMGVSHRHAPYQTKKKEASSCE